MERNTTINLPGFKSHTVETYNNLMDQNKRSGYAIQVTKTYDQMREYMSDEVRKDVRFTTIIDKYRRLSRKKTEQDYNEQYDDYYRTMRDVIQQSGIGVYRADNKDELAELIPLDELARTLTSSFIGFDCLEDARNDPEVTDIYCMSYNQIVVEKAGKNQAYWKQFRSEQDYRIFIDRILMEDNKQLNQGANKIVDAEIYGIRLNVIDSSVSAKGITATFRKHAEEPITLEDMVKSGNLTEDMAWFCKQAVRGALNACIAGVTGSGKTTFLKALFEAALGNGDPDYYIDPEMNRVITVEDTPELFLRVPHTVALHTVPTGDESTRIDLRDLNISALRMKPHYIVVGEIRGVEAASYIEAAATGHSSWTSIHAGTVRQGINRFVDKYGMTMPNLSSAAVERIIGTSVNYFIMIDNIPGLGRKVTAIHELVYNHEEDRVDIHDIVRFEFRRGFVWHNLPSEDSINMMLRRGVKQDEIDEMMAHIQRMIDKSKGKGVA